jgi:cytochrome c6
VIRPVLAAALGLLATAAGAGDLQRGAELYRRHCTGCHGDGGRPRMAGAPDFTVPTALMKTDLALAATVRGGRGAMPAFAGLLRERELLDVVAHLRTLR